MSPKKILLIVALMTLVGVVVFFYFRQSPRFPKKSYAVRGENLLPDFQSDAWVFQQATLNLASDISIPNQPNQQIFRIKNTNSDKSGYGYLLNDGELPSDYLWYEISAWFKTTEKKVSVGVYVKDTSLNAENDQQGKNRRLEEGPGERISWKFKRKGSFQPNYISLNWRHLQEGELLLSSPMLRGLKREAYISKSKGYVEKESASMVVEELVHENEIVHQKSTWNSRESIKGDVVEKEFYDFSDQLLRREKHGVNYKGFRYVETFDRNDKILKRILWDAARDKTEFYYHKKYYGKVQLIRKINANNDLEEEIEYRYKQTIKGLNLEEKIIRSFDEQGRVSEKSVDYTLGAQRERDAAQWLEDGKSMGLIGAKKKKKGGMAQNARPRG